MGFVGSAWATDVTFGFDSGNTLITNVTSSGTTSVSNSDGITFTVTAGASGTVTKYDDNTNKLKFQKTTSFTISGGNITKVVISHGGETSRNFTCGNSNFTGPNSSNGVETWTYSSGVTSVTFTNNSGNNLNVSSVVVTYTSSGSTKTTPTLAFASSSVSTTVGANIASPTLTTTNPSSGLSISYATSDATKATVDPSTGVVTGVGVGSANIIATSAVTDTYYSATATYNVQVGTGTLTLSSISDQNLTVGSAVTPATSVTSANGNTVSGVTYTYATDNANVASVTSTGLVTGVAVGTANITVTASASGYNAATKTYKVTVTAATPSVTYPKEWKFEDATSWSGTSLTADGTWWTSAGGGMKYLKATSTSQLIDDDGSTVVPVSAGLYFTADAGKIYLNPDTYLRIGKNGQTTLTIPNVPAGYNIIFKVGSPSSDARGIAVTSSNATLTSGTASTSKTNFIFNVTTTGDVTFQNTSTGGDLLIYDINVVSSTLSDPELKIMSGSTDVSGTTVDLASGTSTYTLSTASGYAGTPTVTSDNTAAVTASISGTTLTLTYVGIGTANVTVTAPANGTFTSGSATITVNTGATATMTFNPTAVSTVYGRQTAATYPKLIYTAGSKTITYAQYPSTGETAVSDSYLVFASSNTAVATVNASTGATTLVGVGTTTISATMPAKTIDGTGYRTVTATMTLTVTSPENGFIFNFNKKTALVNVGKTIKLKVSFPGGKSAGEIGDITVTSSDESIATVSAGTVDYTNGYVYVTVTAKNTAANAGSDVVITANLSGGTYSGATATICTVSVTAADQRNFSFINHSGTMFVDDYIAIPGITGNANGSSQSFGFVTTKNNTSTGITSTTSTTYQYDGYIAPLYTTSGTGSATLYYVNGGGTNNTANDTIFVHATAAGTLTITATDAQNSTTDTYTLTILSKDDLDAAHTTAVSAINYPYTWDFTKDFSTDAFATDYNYWIDNGTYYSDNVGYYNNENMINQGTGRKFLDKKITAGSSLVTPFKGLLLELKQGTFDGKIDRVRVAKYDPQHPSAPRLSILGDHFIILPNAVVNESGAYRIYVKASGGSGNYATISGTGITGASKSFTTDGSWNYYDVPSGSGSKDVKFEFKNVNIYCICVSTEAKNISTAKYASYAYNEDMDLSLTEESQGVASYAVTSTGSNTATLTKVTKAKAGQGLIIYNSNLTEATNYYFLPNARNVETYTTTLVGTTKEDGTQLGATDNKLVGVLNSTTVISGNTTSTTWNYILSNYYYDKNNGNTKKSGDVGFYVATDNLTLKKNSAYLPVDKSANAKPCLLMTFDDSEVTGIKEVNTTETETGDGYYYNLNGTRTENPSKGIFIHNGKKIVIK